MYSTLFLLSAFAEPKLQRRTVYSETLQKKMHISTITENISHSEFGYLVILMLHGLGDDDLGFRGNIGYFEQSSIPLMIVLPEGERGYWSDGGLGNYASWALEAFELERERLGGDEGSDDPSGRGESTDYGTGCHDANGPHGHLRRRRKLRLR